MKPLAFHLTMRPDHVGIITIDVPDEKMNTLKAEFAGQMRQIIAEARANPQLAGLVIISGKADSFIAGADIRMIEACQSAQQAQSLAEQGQQVMIEIANLPFPVVAAIHGACLGGGLELALACDQRICTLDDKTRLGLPEAQLGLLPGSGGTQRLPALIGTPQALKMMLTGKSLRSRQALKCGLVDQAVAPSILLDTAIQAVLKGRKKRQRLPLRDRLAQSFAGRPLLFYIIHKQALRKTQGNYPAVERILAVVRRGLEQDDGYAAEAQAFGELAMTPQSAALRAIFFGTSEMKKERDAPPRGIHRIGVLGGGLMGGGIASVTAMRARLPVRIKDINNQGINHAMQYSWDLLSKKVKCRHIKPAERQQQISLISGGTDYQGFTQRDIVLEAVFEDLNLKQQMVADIEQHCGPNTIFASNTSSLPIADIAARAQRPENIIGLHYFSPVDKMPLVEVIPHAGTSQETVATTVALARKQGKTPIVVADRAGFYVNRILAPYINEALYCLLACEPIEHIDGALVKFGFPVGPLQLLDEVGIDVGSKIVPVLQHAFGNRFTAPAAFDAVLNDGRKGRKNRHGFYSYDAPRWRGRRPDTSLYRLLNLQPKSQLAAAAIAQRCVAMMLNEAVRCLDEGVIRSVRDGDIGAIFGIGFPPFTGGPFRYIDSIGAENLRQLLNSLMQLHGERFAPCAALISMAEQGKKYYPAQSMTNM